MSKCQETPKIAKSVLNIEGTRANVENSQLLTSSGIRTIDELLGGGLPVGTLVLIEEDRQCTYSNILLKYFLAEGVANKHSLFVASKDVITEKLVQELPSVIETDLDNTPLLPQSSHQNEKMKIAFRYQNLPKFDKGTSRHLGHAFDLTKLMPNQQIESSDITHWHPSDNIPKNPKLFSKPAYFDLLQSIKRKIAQGQFHLKDKPTKRSILRVAISSLGSPLWGCTKESDLNDLKKFIYYLRVLLRSAFAIGIVTLPSQLIDRQIIDRCIHSSDITVQLHAFTGTELENNPILSSYHGYFNVIKFAAINSFVSKHPGSVEYVFKLRRKKFYIEKLHLPPDLEVAKSEIPSMGCGSSNKHLLEF